MMLRRTARTLALATAALMLATVPTLAEGGHKHHGKHFKHKHRKHAHKHHKYHHKHRHHHDGYVTYSRHHDYRHVAPRYRSYRVDHRRFDIPRRLHRDHYVRYDRFYHGRDYYAPHRHHHRVYYFPVVVEDRLLYRSHAYCDGELYVARHRNYRDYDDDVAIGYRGRRVSFDVRF